MNIATYFSQNIIRACSFSKLPFLSSNNIIFSPTRTFSKIVECIANINFSLLTKDLSRILSIKNFKKMIRYLLVFSLSTAMALNFGCFNDSQIELMPRNISREILSSVDRQFCYNQSYYNSAVAFNYYHQNRTCEFLYNYSLTYRVIKNNASQMCILQLPDSQRTGS